MLKESTEQSVFVRYAKLKGITVVAIPNGVKISGGLKNKYAYVNALKLQGLQAGFPDLMVLYNNGKHEVLFIEFKRKKGGRLSETQKDWQFELKSAGYATCVCAGAEEAILKLHEYMGGKYD